MSSQKRLRACDACHAIKIKCELGSNEGEPPCARCSRLNKDCVITPPKRQKDRVAELEAKVQALTRLLEAQGLTTPQESPEEVGSAGDEATPSVPTGTAASKKRRLGDNVSSKDAGLGVAPLSAVSYSSALMELDRIVPVETQARIYHRYVHEIVPRFPFVPVLDGQTLEVMRSTRPLVLQAIIYASCTGILMDDEKDKVARLLLDENATNRILASEKSLELLQAMQIASIWYWSPKHHKHVAAHQLVPLLGDIAISIGISGPATTPFGHPPDHAEEIGSADAWRTWVVCYMLSASWSVYMRRPNALMWTEYHDMCVAMLQYNMNALPSDRLVDQYVRGERLCEIIASELRFSDWSMALDVGEPATQATMRTLNNKILDRQAQVPADLRRSEVLFWQQAANIYLHEVVLHTATNKQSFAAPFLAERLSVTDFPAPLITPEHTRCVHALKDACYIMLDTYCAFDTDLLLASGSMLFTPRALYAVFLLIKLYIAASAHGNTYGTIINVQYLNVKPYLQSLGSVGKKVGAVDPRAGPAVILSATSRLEEWLDNYRATLFVAAPNDILQSMPSLLPQQQPLDDYTEFVWDDPILGDGSLDDLFASDLGPNWSLQPGMANHVP